MIAVAPKLSVPVTIGAVHDTVAPPLVGAALSPVGGSGGVGITAAASPTPITTIDAVARASALTRCHALFLTTPNRRDDMVAVILPIDFHLVKSLENASIEDLAAPQQ